MPKTIPAALASHLAEPVTTLAVCWKVERSDGVLILGTEHDRDITIDAGSPTAPYSGTYRASAGITGSNIRSSSDMSVDNMDVNGAVNSGDLSLVDLSAADIEAGLFDDAAVVLFLVNWQAPDDGQIVLRTGNIGAITRTAEGQYRTELRGLTQRLTQNIVRTYGSSCDADLGDARCGVDITDLRVAGNVTDVTNNRLFVADIGGSSPADSYDITLFLPMSADIQVGDTFTLQPGCDKSIACCKERFSNLVNFRGHGYLVPGTGELSTFGGQTSERAFVGSVIERAIESWLASHPFPESVSGSPLPPFYNGGLVIWTSGNNAGFSMEVKLAELFT